MAQISAHPVRCTGGDILKDIIKRLDRPALMVDYAAQAAVPVQKTHLNRQCADVDADVRMPLDPMSNSAGQRVGCNGQAGPDCPRGRANLRNWPRPDDELSRGTTRNDADAVPLSVYHPVEIRRGISQKIALRFVSECDFGL